MQVMRGASVLLEDAPALRLVGVSSPKAWSARVFPSLQYTFTCYGAATLFVGIAFGLTFFLQRFFPYPFLFFFFGAVVASAWFCGTGPGLFSVLVSTVSAEYFFLPPFDSLLIKPAVEAYFASFVACSLIASWVSSSKRKTEVALLQARDELEERISERTAALMRTQGDLAHLSRMLSMAELTASIVHEVGQPLTGVVTNGQACLEWLSADPPNTEKARRSADSIVRDGIRAGAVLNRIRALFQKGPPEKEWLNLNDLIHDLMVLLRDEARRREVRIYTHFAYDLPKVKVDRIQLQQVILNLMVNAMDAMNETPVDDKRLLLNSRKNGNDVIVRVEDYGAGLKPEFRERIFEPFFSTKPHGIGVGLSICRSIVESHNGQIHAVPRAEGGTALEFTIPIAARSTDD
jgi:C4-dicarboxylate-specific signal transduction histidine kinase